MNKIKKIIAVFLTCFMISTVAMPITAMASTKINKTSVTLRVNKTCKLKISGTKKSVKWSSSNKKIATVNSNGKVKGIKPGKATIYAKIGKTKLSCKVTVKKAVKKNPANIEIKRISDNYLVLFDEEQSYYDSDSGTFYIVLQGMKSRNAKGSYLKIEGFDKNGNRVYYDVLGGYPRDSISENFYLSDVPDNTVSIWVSDYN